MDKWKDHTLSLINHKMMENYFSEWIRKLTYVKRNEKLNLFDGPMGFVDYMMKAIEILRDFMPLIGYLKTKGFEIRHMNMINKEYGISINLY